MNHADMISDGNAPIGKPCEGLTPEGEHCGLTAGHKCEHMPPPSFKGVRFSDPSKTGFGS